MSRLAARYRQTELEHEHLQRLRLADVPEQTTVAIDHALRRYEQTKGGDRRELRGLPLSTDAEGFGLPAAIAGTSPGTDEHLAALDRAQRRRQPTPSDG